MRNYKVKIIGVIIAAFVLIVTVIAIQQQVSANAGGPPERAMSNKQQAQGKPTQSRPAPPSSQVPDVSIIWQEPGQYQSLVQAYGAVAAHYEIDLTAQIAGEVATISSQFETGYQVQQGETLVMLENSQYRADLAEAQQNLAEARVALLEEERQGKQALLEWQRSGLSGEPDSELVLRKPQLAAAQRRLEQAQTAVDYAKRNLSYSQIQAPFDAIVVSRNVAPGSYVQMGSTIATLHSTDRAEISLALSETDWHNLPDIHTMQTEQWPVTLSHIESQQTWTAYVLRAEQHLTEDTRQRRLIVAVDHPFEQTPALYTGTFVSATVMGKTQAGLWQLPSTALSPRGEVWYVDQHQRLAKITSRAAFSRDGHVYIPVPEALKDQRVAVLIKPLNSYLTGMPVKAVEYDNESR